MSAPLSGRSIVVVRAAEQAGSFGDRLKALGARVVLVPVIEIADPADGGAALRAAAERVRGYGQAYDWVVLTSVNAARRWTAACPPPWPPRLCIACVGPGTAGVLEALGRSAELVPARNVGEGLVAAFPDPPTGGGRVLLPRAARARDVVPEGLRALGWQVDVVEAYRTVAAVVDPAVVEAAAGADAIAFTSGSTVRNYVAAVGLDHVPPIVVCIGPETAGTAASLGLTVSKVAEPYTLDGLFEAVQRALARG